MKILLDHNLDRRLKNHLIEHDVSTTQEQGWADVLNGELLTLLESEGFDVMLTADANIKSQQNMTNRQVSILVLRAFNNRLATHIEMLEDIEKALAEIQIGEIIEVLHKDLKAKLEKDNS
ncbi:MAG TPA: hypothetical protein PKE69_23380 [Pyrinomonadaceae bacterium]|nr:hypothetical protein [Pyrinomonadaceae bacterium]